jgi:putative ABC transport system permease protein
MLGSCLVSAWRNLKCRKGYSIVNVCGLGLGLAAALFVVLFLGFELGYDRHFEKASRIFRAVTPEYTGSPYVFSGRVLGEVPEVEAVCAIKAAESSSFSEKVVLTVDGHRRFEDRMFYVEPSFFRIFGVHFIHGRLETALAHPRAVVLTRRAALRQFGTTECVGRVLLLEDKWPLQVEAVIEDPPGPSHFKFNMLVPAEAAAEFSGYDDRSEWGDWNYRVYLLLKPGASSADAERKLVRCFPEDVRRERAGSRLDPAGLRLQRLTDIHLRSHLRGEFEPNGDIRWVVFFSALGFLILAASVLNFVNLATAQALRRNREVGLRKVLGAARRQIAIQHLGEALLLTAAAAALGLFLLRLAFPLLREVVGPDLGWDGIPWTRIALLLPLIVLLAALAAGGYPSIFAASLRPVESLKGGGDGRSRRFRARGLILGFQFMASVGFVTAALIVSSQMRYVKTKDLGIDTDRVINIRLSDDVRDKTGVLKRELLSRPGVLAAAASNFLPGRDTFRQTFDWDGREPGDDARVRWIAVDADFLEVFGIRVLEGQAFAPGDETRAERSYLVNESAAKRFGWDRAAGKRLEVQSAFGKPGRVVGVVKDFHFRPLYFPIEPLALILVPNTRIFRFVSVKVSGRDLPATLRFIQDFCDRRISGGEGIWEFYDDEFGRIYQREVRTSRLLGFLAALAAVLAGLGVFGLTAFMVESRRREISIRKVLGADALRVLALVSRDFLRTLVVGASLAAPGVYAFARGWLVGFAYRIVLGPWFFAAGLGLVSTVLLAAVGWHTLRAANADPAVVLRSE